MPCRCCYFGCLGVGAWRLGLAVSVCRRVCNIIGATTCASASWQRRRCRVAWCHSSTDQHRTAWSDLAGRKEVTFEQQVSHTWQPPNGRLRSASKRAVSVRVSDTERESAPNLGSRAHCDGPLDRGVVSCGCAGHDLRRREDAGRCHVHTGCGPGHRDCGPQVAHSRGRARARAGGSLLLRCLPANARGSGHRRKRPWTWPHSG